jgi:hypothetical protein
LPDREKFGDFLPDCEKFNDFLIFDIFQKKIECRKMWDKYGMWEKIEMWEFSHNVG